MDLIGYLFTFWSFEPGVSKLFETIGVKMPPRKKVRVSDPTDRKKYRCSLCYFSSQKPVPFIDHYMQHAGEQYECCYGCGKRKPSKHGSEWETEGRHSCIKGQGDNPEPPNVRIVTIKWRELRRTLMQVHVVPPTLLPDSDEDPDSEDEIGPEVAAAPVDDMVVEEPAPGLAPAPP
jgi:hypothetical protein